MKRILCVLTILLLILVGCNNKAPEPIQQESSLESASEVPNASNQEEPSSHVSEDNKFDSNKENEQAQNYKPTKTFVNTTAKTIEVFDALMEARGYPKTSGLPMEDSESEVTGNGSYNMKTITIGDGAYLYLSETLNENILFGISCYGEMKKMSDETFEQFDFYILAILNMLGDDLQRLTNELSLETTTETITSAQSKYADFSYIVINDTIMFSANPK